MAVLGVAVAAAMSLFGGSKKSSTVSPDAPLAPRFEPTANEVKQLALDTHFNEQEVSQLAQRFVALDNDGSGNLTADELLHMPEISMYPLIKRVLAMHNGAVAELSVP